MYLSDRISTKFCLCVVMVLCTHACAQEENTIKITDKVLSCSHWLSSLIDNLCNKVIKVVKRDTSLMMEKLVPKDLQDHMNKQRLLSTERWRRVRRQVATECCERACTVGTIIMYCPEDAKLVLEDPDIFYK